MVEIKKEKKNKKLKILKSKIEQKESVKSKINIFVNNHWNIISTPMIILPIYEVIEREYEDIELYEIDDYDNY